MPLKWDAKDPDEVLDYEIDWSDFLGDDTIDTSTWTMPTEPDAALIKDSDSHTTTATTIWLSGGTLAAVGEPATVYELVNTIVTDGLRTAERTVRLKIKTK